ncbi:transposase [Allomeiothermus silvanus]|uniref:transposase n=1 Tax=Allomeiothermus silvanus TaxID=52022 RepID=UPI0023F29EE3|nr:transposase [Allomeiothermus silvanus]
MSFDPDRRQRRSIRLKGFDYSSIGAYFVTVCVQGRMGLFELIDGEMHLSPAGEMVSRVWAQIPRRFPSVLAVSGDHKDRPYPESDPHRDEPCARPDHPEGTTAGSLGRVVQAFKSLTTVKYARGVKGSGGPPFDKRLWQRNYYERILRDEDKLQAVREYIVHNPLAWHTDEENPNAHPAPAL